MKLTRARKKAILRENGWIEQPDNYNIPRGKMVWCHPNYPRTYVSWVNAWRMLTAGNPLLEIETLVREASK